MALLDLVELVLHTGRVSSIKKVVKAGDQQVVYGSAERGRVKTALDALDILAVLDRRHDRRVGRRAADAFFLERFDKRSFRVARGRLGKMLLAAHIVQFQVFALLDERQIALLVIVLALGRLIVAAFLVNLQKTVELLDRAGRAKRKASGLDVDSSLIEYGRGLCDATKRCRSGGKLQLWGEIVFQVSACGSLGGGCS